MVSCKNEKKDNVNLEEVSLTKADSTNVALVTQAYLYGYPMMTMDYTHKISSNVVSDNGMGKGPINQWGNMHKFPKAGFTEVVRPNLDTYYKCDICRFSPKPLIPSYTSNKTLLPSPILNAHGDVIKSVGSRTTGQGAIDIALVGPTYEGEIDDDLTVVRSTTNLNWMLGRVAVKNNEDGKAEIAKFQSKLIARPLSERHNKKLFKS